MKGGTWEACVNGKTGKYVAHMEDGEEDDIESDEEDERSIGCQMWDGEEDEEHGIWVEGGRKRKRLP